MKVGSAFAKSVRAVFMQLPPLSDVRCMRAVDLILRKSVITPGVLAALLFQFEDGTGGANLYKLKL